MKSTVTESMFIDAFLRRGRESQFSRAALSAIFDYIEEYEADSGEEQELDVIAICCEWVEYDNALAAAEEYGYQADPDDDEDVAETLALDWLEGRTTVRTLGGDSSDGIVMVQF